MKKTFNLILIAGILIGLPLFAWYYLSKGTQMRKDAMADLIPKAELGNFQTSLEDESIFYSDSLLGKNWIVAIIGADSTRSKHVNILNKLYTQTKEEFSVNVFTIIGLYHGELLRDMSQLLGLPNSKNWLKSYMAANHVYPFSAEAFSIPEHLKNQNVILLMDKNGKIRNYYSLLDDASVVDLVRHIPVFLSLKDPK